MRQVVKLMRAVGRADLIDFYNSTLSYGTIHGAKLPSLNEFLDLTLNETRKEDSSTFDENTDRFLEEQALKKLEERRRNGK